MLLLVGIMALPNLRDAWNYKADAPQNAAYRNTPAAVKFEYGVLYLGLAAVLSMMAYSVHGSLSLAR